MNLLWIDTASQACSIAIGDEQTLHASQNLPIRQGQAEKLIPLIQDMLLSAELKASHIHKIAVTCGPGSFTAVRIGLAVARMLAQVLKVQCLGVSNFELIGQQLQYQQKKFPASSSVALSIHSFRTTPFIQIIKDNKLIGTPLSASDELLKKHKVDKVIMDSDKDEEFWQAHHISYQRLEETDKEGFLHHLIRYYLSVSDEALYPAIPLYIRDADAKASTQKTKKITIS